MIDIVEELKILISQLDERQIDYALCGGLALAIYDRARATATRPLPERPDETPARLGSSPLLQPSIVKCNFPSAFNQLFHEFVVFLVTANPKPDYQFISTTRESTIATTDSN